MASIAKTIWGPKPSLLRWVFRCVVRPMIVYASIVWAHSNNTDSKRNSLRKITRLAICPYTMFPRSLPTRALEILNDTFPTLLWLEKEALCAFIRLAKQLDLSWSGINNNKTNNEAHRHFWANKVAEYNIEALLLEVDTC